jgi:molybdate transport system substrate-binding protein
MAMIISNGVYVRINNRFIAFAYTTLRQLLPVLLTASVVNQSFAGEVSVAVAANFTEAAREIATAFEKASGHHSRLSFGSTGQLYTQITNGAPFEVFLAADAARPEKAEQAGYAVNGSRFTYARGALVLWSPKPDLFDDGEAWLRRGEYGRIAIANPKTAPYGLAAQQVLQKLALWDRLAGELARGNSIAQTFQFVATGNADAGFVALSQVIANKAAGNGDAGSVWNIPADDYAPIEQQAVLLRSGENNPAAVSFIAFMKSTAARAIISGYGYTLP